MKPTPICRIMLLVLVVLLGTTRPTQAQAPAWQSVLAVGQQAAGAYLQVEVCTPDASGNIYLAGTFTGAISIGTTALTSAGSYDIFIAKWSTALNAFVWAQRAGGTQSDGVSKLVVAAGNVYLTGSVTGTASFGPLTLTGQTDISRGFLVKLTDSGPTASFGWLKAIGNAGGGYSTGLVVRGAQLFVTGVFLGTASFDNTTLTSAGSTDVYVVKLLDTGLSANAVWARRMGGPGAEASGTLWATATGELYVTGQFAGTADFGPVTLTSIAAKELFVVKLTETATAPTFAWSRQLGGEGFWYSTLAVSGNNVYVGGHFNGVGRFGPTTLTSLGSATSDVFIARLTDQGTSAEFAWVQRAGGTGDDYLKGLLVEDTDVYAAGGFTLTANFGSIALTNTRRFEYDVFVAKLTDTNAAGRFDWAQSATGSLNTNVTTLLKQGDALYVGGHFVVSASFGPLSVSGPALVYSSFLAKLSTTTTATAATPVSRLPLAFYPNPAHSSVSVPAATASTVLTLHDAVGRTVRTATGAQLSVAGLAPGLYVLQAATPGQPVRTGKLVVE